jgi:serine phosphatase RsbU (regulator of sigma subunit)
MSAQAIPSSAGAGRRDIGLVIAAALSHLGGRDFLAELLDRAKETVRADTAAVLLLDYSSGHLVAAAARGLEEEVRQGTRIPVGRGFAGRIAVEHKPVIIDEVDHTKVLNPVLLAKGVRSLLGVPLVADGRVIGVLHAGSRTARNFTRDDAQVLELAADRAARAVQSLLAQADHAAVAVLQQSLLPSGLPVIEGAQIAGRYVAGQGVVGGDWYDVFVLPSGEVSVVVGDVAGSGLRAAVIMGRMRSALRAYALDTPDPAEVLGRLDRKMQHFEPGALATVVYAVFAPALDRVHIASAGHLPPVLAIPGRPTKLADTAGLMIGVDPGAQRRAATMKFPPGSLLCLYTDGLIERPGEPIDDSLARLCHAVTPGPPDAVCSAVMMTLVGYEPSRDDIALLMLRRQPPDPARHN